MTSPSSSSHCIDCAMPSSGCCLCAADGGKDGESGEDSADDSLAKRRAQSQERLVTDGRALGCDYRVSVSVLVSISMHEASLES
jgi:hypothetical protein